ncbi:MAG: lysylphosphatidylglycerol synthase transmembrane domain-containing protein [Gemmatimonadota bacterium]
MNRRSLGWALGVVLFLGVALLVHFSVGWRALLAPWKEIPPGSLGVALFLVLVSYALRTVRIHQYFAPATTGAFTRSFRLVLIHNLFNNLLPMRSGEASFPLLMKRDFQVPFARSVPGLFYLRLLDLHFLLFLGAVVFAPGRGIPGWAAPAVLLPLPVLGFLLQKWVQDRVGSGAMGAGRRVTWLEGLPRSRRLFLGTWLWTGINWSVKLLVFAWILRAFSPVSYPTALLGSITGELSSVLPFHGLAGAGTYEAGVMAGLLPMGVGMEAALAGAVNLHLFVLGTSILSGLLALPLSRRGEAHGMRADGPIRKAGESEGGS